jgi:hypothetical protein
LLASCVLSLCALLAPCERGASALSASASLRLRDTGDGRVRERDPSGQPAARFVYHGPRDAPQTAARLDPAGDAQRGAGGRSAPGSQATPPLADLIQQLSEPGGYFDSDNLISNESSYLQVSEALDALPKGGVYLGVGPEQNYTYIARLRPRWAFILDIRRQNMLQHLFMSALLEDAADPYQYLCRLFSRPCPSTPETALGSIEATLTALGATPPDEDTFTRNLAAVLQDIEGRQGFDLQPQDRMDVRAIYKAFFDEQVEIRFKSNRRPWATYTPSYRSLLVERSPSGRFGCFLASPADYRFVRQLVLAGRVVPVVGDFAGPHALRAIGNWLRERKLTVSEFYVSNVEFYLLRADAFPRFVENVRALPITPDSLLIRACFDYGRPHPAQLPGHKSATVLEKIPRFLELFDSGAYRSYWDVCTADYLR